MADPYPLYPELRPARPDAPYCSGSAVGCTVSSTAAIIERYTGTKITNLTALGNMMRAKHRAVASGVRCGVCPHGWCHYCMYLELKSRGIAVGYGNLTWSQVTGHLKAGHAIGLPGWYGQLPYVSPTSYGPTTPARGRSDSWYGPHSIVAWGLSSAGLVIASDADFGSSSRPNLPSHSLLSQTAVRAYYEHLGWAACYTLQKPHAQGVGLPSATVSWRVVIRQRTPLYAWAGGPRIGFVSRATYTTQRQKTAGSWWYRITGPRRSAHVGRWIPAEPWLVVTQV